ncbi:MAG: acetyl-CoA carboxylase biotin carboxylase subunit [bacterium]
MFRKVLVANRGEIALRVIRACREMGIQSVAVFSEADKESLHVRMADQAVCIGPPPSSKSYLNLEAIMEAAKATGVEAVHPGYGYLAEEEELAMACQRENLVFIGPTPENLRLAGDKILAKQTVARAGVPVLPSSHGAIGSLEEALSWADRIGYPVLIKAAGGGGGRGIRVCQNEEDLREEYPIAKAEAKAAFGNDEVYMEKRITSARHVEFQILADVRGEVVHLGERECTIQRRYQKLIEESPSPSLSPGLRDQMGHAAVAAARAVNYRNAGTVEFLLDPEGRFYFMEINARIQVEHPVTEQVTGLDLVKEQIRIAWEEPLMPFLKQIKPSGWALECRINAEDPQKGFLPCPGLVEELKVPGGFGVRVDTHLYQGYELPMYYDSLVAKLISYDRTRQGAISVMRRALKEFVIHPIRTTIPLHLRILEDPDFLAGRFDTEFVKRFFPQQEDEQD